MRRITVNLFIFIMIAAVPVFAQQGTVPASHSLSWGWLMTLGLIAGMVLGLIVRPRNVDQSEQIDRHDRAA